MSTYKKRENSQNHQAAAGINMGSCDDWVKDDLKSENELFELLKSNLKLSIFTDFTSDFNILEGEETSGGLVTMGDLSIAVSTFCLEKIPITSFASLGIFFSSGLLSDVPMCLYMSSGSTRNLYIYLSPWIFLSIPLW